MKKPAAPVAGRDKITARKFNQALKDGSLPKEAKLLVEEAQKSSEKGVADMCYMEAKVLYFV